MLRKIFTVDIFAELLLLVVLSLFFCDHCLVFSGQPTTARSRTEQNDDTTFQLNLTEWASGVMRGPGAHAGGVSGKWGKQAGKRDFREDFLRVPTVEKKRNGTLRAEIPHTMTYTIIERRSKCAGWHFSAERSGGGCHWKIGWRSDLIILVRARDSRRRERSADNNWDKDAGAWYWF